MNEQNIDIFRLPLDGLSGGLMRFDPASLMLWVDRPKAELTQSFEAIQSMEEPQSDFLFLNRPSLARQALQEHGLNDYLKPLLGRLRHETDHLRHHLCTSFGLFSHYLSSKFPISAVDLYRTKLQSQAFPLIDAAAEQCIDNIELKDLEADNLSPHAVSLINYTMNAELLACLNGDNRSRNDILVPWAIVSYQYIVTSSAKSPSMGFHSKPDTPSLLPFLNLDDSWCPQVFGRRFGARHLLEAFAFTSELSLAQVLGYSDDSWDDMLGLDEYRLVTRYWHNLFGESAVLKERRGQWLNELLTNSSLPSYPMEFFAALDLALWIPITPRGLCSPSNRMMWHDFHPGWRFLKICDLLKRRQKDWNEIPFELRGADKTFREIQNDICSELGWPHVDDLLLEWLSFLQESAKYGNSAGYYIDQAVNHPRYLSSIAFLARRAIEPYQITMGYADLSKVIVTWFPMMITRDGRLGLGGRYGRAWDHAKLKNAERLTAYFLIHGARYFAEGRRRMYHVRRMDLCHMLCWLANYGGVVRDRFDGTAFVTDCIAYLVKSGMSEDEIRAEMQELGYC